MAKTVKIFKKALFSHLQALTNCKVSEKSNERFPRKSVADGRTYGRTDATPKVSNFAERPKIHDENDSVCTSLMMNTKKPAIYCQDWQSR